MELRYYQTSTGSQPFADWLAGLHDRQARARVDARLVRIDWGPGYRIYFAQVGKVVVLLLCGGDKRSQSRDIGHAKAYFQDFKARSAQRKRRT